jgi:hypothetical protein
VTDEQAFELAKAREALDRGKPRRAVRRLWKAGIAASQNADVEGLETVIELAGATGDRAGDHVKAEAQQLVTYCTASLTNARAGIRPPSLLAGLLRRRLEPATKPCPDCAERVNEAARVCRFCGYGFDEPSCE